MNKMPAMLGLALVAMAAAPLAAQDYQRPAVPSLRDRVAAHDRLVKARLDQVVPKIMREVGVDMWVLVASEYNEDPVVKAMLPATWASARRRMVLIFFDRGPDKGVERLAIARYPVGDLFPSLWNPEQQPEQWARVAQVIAERNPKRIAVNISRDFALADGLATGERLRQRYGKYRHFGHFHETAAALGGTTLDAKPA